MHVDFLPRMLIGVIIEHEGKNVAHVPARVIEPAEVIEDVSRAT
jgi:hypothetical protein